MSKGQSYSLILTYLKRRPNDFFLFLSFLGVEIGDILMLAPLPPSIRAGWVGEVASWVLPCPSTLPTRGRGWGTRNSPYIDNLPYVQSSMIPELYIPSDNSISKQH